MAEEGVMPENQHAGHVQLLNFARHSGLAQPNQMLHRSWLSHEFAKLAKSIC
jgi:hypothetical protein